jgi:tetratricopeptide (TPR) repeat protein
LGLNSFIKKDYKRAEKYFERLNKISRYNLVFDNFIGNVLIAWIRASQRNEEDSYKFIKKIPSSYNYLKKIQNIFLQCYFDSDATQKSLQELVDDEDYNFSRYNFFLVNYLLSKNKIIEAEKIIQNSRKKYSSNLLIKQTEFFFLNDNNEKIRNFFDCKNPKDSLAEFFYVMANLYSTEKEYRLSNFYLKISFFLNNKFLPNRALLAENFYYQKKFTESKNIYYSLKSIGSVYSWHASKNIASIFLDEKGKKYSVNSLEDDFNLLPNPNFEHYYELANFYKDNEYYKESIKYYSLALRKIKNDHPLVPKIFDRRGISFERLGDWENAEKNLIESLKILPDQAHVLNYLAYSWIDRGINLDRGLEMLKKATELRKNDGYIIDSLGWAYYAKKDYDKAKFFLQKAVELLPSDPIINDHYADALWMLNKNIQARYIWNNVLKLKGAEEKLKGDIKKKLIFGITR